MNKIKLAPWQLAPGAAVFIALGNNATLFSALADSPEIHSLAGFNFVASITLRMIFVLDASFLAIGFGQLMKATIASLMVIAADFDSFLFYASDHGESLGEKGVYLHGLPYAIAPDAQTIVPFVFWASPGFRNARMREAQLSHDNISHTLLGLYDVDASSYRKQLDLFAG